MIEGLHYDLTTEQLIQHFAEREQHHLNRAAFYLEQADKFRATDVEEVRMKMSSYTSNPVEDFLTRKKSHEKTARQFACMSKYLVPYETYRLAEREMDNLEFYE